MPSEYSLCKEDLFLPGRERKTEKVWDVRWHASGIILVRRHAIVLSLTTGLMAFCHYGHLVSKATSIGMLG
ncbi:hypothetical protein SODALDRAFT_335199 [Sodiomyces alkalinus F11]|uniref:Uncharacterized protein n=1 Tax=Sodiomyces alkalinus (strain CBS 110278 / VKM F-3762 / F11) TaxID=1314773 RepID=A0A3N2PR44_SODAK|nr:hypothetical protein SODALDRAFT_335199 [Sodiomyces alkalinus F11]ROT36981.1 hypothetical protein SODALDRAFT_335199 [Sodiomyces alkalinus F11]